MIRDLIALKQKQVAILSIFLLNYNDWKASVTTNASPNTANMLAEKLQITTHVVWVYVFDIWKSRCKFKKQ